MSPRTFYSKGPHPILWAGSRVSLGKTAISEVPKSKLFYNIYRIYTIDRCGRGPHNTTWRPAARGLETHDLHFH